SSILGPDATVGSAELDLFVEEVAREMTVKAGQKCTAIRKAIVPATLAAQVLEALRARLANIVLGDPRLEQVKMGPVASGGQRREVLGQLGRVQSEAQTVLDGRAGEVLGADGEKGAFIAPALLFCADPHSAAQVHCVEAFGPVCTVMPYRSRDDALLLARR